MSEILIPASDLADGQAVLVTSEMIKTSAEVRCYLQAADQQAVLKGFTEHGFRHAGLVSTVTHGLLTQLQVPARRADLGAIAGYIHDIGNVVGRQGHAPHGGVLAAGLLGRMGMPPEEMLLIMAAIANHDEDGGCPVSDISAALILADKSDVHLSRVRNRNPASFDQHDRVNHAALHSYVRIDSAKKVIIYDLTIDTASLPGGVLDYMEIFLPRMLMARKAAEFLGCQFELHVNNSRVA